MRDNGSDVAVIGDGLPPEAINEISSLHLFQDFRWSKRARSSFHECNIHTLEQLTRVDPTRLLKCSNVGRGTLKEIHRKLSARGLGLNFTRRQLSSMRIWTPEKRVEQSEAIKAAHAKTRAMTEREQEREREREERLRERLREERLQDLKAAHAKTRALDERERERERERLQDDAIRVEGIEKNFVESMEMAIGAGAIAEARSLLDCCTPLMAKTIIDVVSAIESEKT